MATAAVVSKDTILKVKVGAGTLVKAGELKDFSGLGGGSTTIIDATHLESSAKEKLTGTPDEGSHSFTFNYVPTDAGQRILIDAYRSGAVVDAEFTLTKAARKFTYKLFVTKAETTGGVDKILELSVTAEITGSVAEAPVT